MEFQIKNIQKSTSDLMRQIGYQPAYFSRSVRDPANGGGKIEEFSIIRKVSGNDYPRFHLYIKQDGNNFIFNLHLDQKKPSYSGAKGHSGEYDGEVIESEAERIKSILQ